VAAWLVFQVASLAALVPRECCAAHRAAAIGKKPSCHEHAVAPRCPMPTAAGTPCPMHRTGDTDVDEKPRDGCAMRGTCAGPMAALFALLSNYGVLADSFQLLPDGHAGAGGVGTRENLITRLAPPDTPPPRA
jgi:hypothetical protein